MRKVTCYECGKHYNYDDDGFCPRCGGELYRPGLRCLRCEGGVV